MDFLGTTLLDPYTVASWGRGTLLMNLAHKVIKSQSLENCETGGRGVIESRDHHRRGSCACREFNRP